MTTTLWHRFPSRNLQAIVQGLQCLLDDDKNLIDRDEKRKISQLQETVERGFAAKQDGDLEPDFLILCLEFALVTCHDERAQQLRKILQGVRAYALSLKPVPRQGSGG